MYKISAALISLLLLSGCLGTTTVATSSAEMRKISIPSRYLDCQRISNLPDPSTLTDKQVSDVLLRYDSLLRACSSDDQSVKRLIAEYNKEVESFNSKFKDQ